MRCTCDQRFNQKRPALGRLSGALLSVLAALEGENRTANMISYNPGPAPATAVMVSCMHCRRSLQTWTHFCSGIKWNSTRLLHEFVLPLSHVLVSSLQQTSAVFPSFTSQSSPFFASQLASPLVASSSRHASILLDCCFSLDRDHQLRHRHRSCRPLHDVTRPDRCDKAG